MDPSEQNISSVFVDKKRPQKNKKSDFVGVERDYLSKSSGPILENCNQYNYEDSIVEYRNFSLTKIEDNVAMMLDEFYGNIHEISHYHH